MQCTLRRIGPVLVSRRAKQSSGLPMIVGSAESGQFLFNNIQACVQTVMKRQLLKIIKHI